MPLPYGWDHEAIAAKLRVLGAEGYPSKQRYAIAIESARADWKDSHPVHNINQMPAHLKRKKKRTAITNTRRRSANMAGGRAFDTDGSSFAEKHAAHAMYKARQREIVYLIGVIKSDLKKHAAKEKSSPRDWGHAGDLGYVIEKLREASRQVDTVWAK